MKDFCGNELEVGEKVYYVTFHPISLESLTFQSSELKRISQKPELYETYYWKKPEDAIKWAIEIVKDDSQRMIGEVEKLLEKYKK